MQYPPNDANLLPVVLELSDRIAARVGPTAEGGCWPWLGGLTYSGYGTYTIWMGYGNGSVSGYRSVRAHRAVFMLHHERPIAEGMTLHHTCHNPPCVNPAHLVEMTHADNNAADAYGGASIRYRKGKRFDSWSVLFRSNGKQTSRTFHSLAEAEAYAESRRPGRVA